MTTDTGYSEEDIALAGEYVLDLLTASERQTFEARLAVEAPLRRLVLEWDESLAPLTDDIPEVEPPALVRARINARLFGKEKRRLIRPWAGALVGALAAAAVVVAVLFIEPAGPSLPTHRAELASTDESIRISAILDADTGTMSVTLLSGGPRPNRTLELWLIADGTPVSLGLLGDDPVTELTLAEEFRDQLAGAALAVSDEPPGGSPSSGPTGDILASGELSTISDA